jgi:hypothetical protein
MLAQNAMLHMLVGDTAASRTLYAIPPHRDCFFSKLTHTHFLGFFLGFFVFLGFSVLGLSVLGVSVEVVVVGVLVDFEQVHPSSSHASHIQSFQYAYANKEDDEQQSKGTTAPPSSRIKVESSSLLLLNPI